MPIFFEESGVLFTGLADDVVAVAVDIAIAFFFCDCLPVAFFSLARLAMGLVICVLTMAADSSLSLSLSARQPCALAKQKT